MNRGDATVDEARFADCLHRGSVMAVSARCCRPMDAKTMRSPIYWRGISRRSQHNRAVLMRSPCYALCASRREGMPEAGAAMSESNFARVRRRCSGGQVEGEARVSKQRRAAVRRPGCGRDFVCAVPHGLRQRKVPYREPSQRRNRSPQKPGSGGLQVACSGP